MKPKLDLSLILVLTALLSSIGGLSARADDSDSIFHLGAGAKLTINKIFDLPANSSLLDLNGEKPRVLESTDKIDGVGVEYSNKEKRTVCGVEYPSASTARFIPLRVMVLKSVDTDSTVYENNVQKVTIEVVDKTIKDIHCVGIDLSLTAISAALGGYITINKPLPEEARLQSESPYPSADE